MAVLPRIEELPPLTLALLFLVCAKNSFCFSTCRKRGSIKPSGVQGRRLSRGLMDVSQWETSAMFCAMPLFLEIRRSLPPARIVSFRYRKQGLD